MTVQNDVCLLQHIASFKVHTDWTDDNKGTGQSTWRLIQGGQVEDVNLYVWEAYETSQESNAKGRVKMKHLENHETHLWEMVW